MQVTRYAVDFITTQWPHLQLNNNDYDDNNVNISVLHFIDTNHGGLPFGALIYRWYHDQYYTLGLKGMFNRSPYAYDILIGLPTP